MRTRGSNSWFLVVSLLILVTPLFPVACAAPDEPAKAPPAQAAEDPEVQSAAETVVLGQVGVVAAEKSIVRASRSAKAKRIATVRKNTPVAVVKIVDDWYGVLMNSGDIGWIYREDVDLTEYELVASKSDVAGITGKTGGDTTALWKSDVVRRALQYTCVYYSFGGTNVSGGIDCSAFVRAVFRQYGVSLPRTAREQAKVGRSVPFNQLQAGDRLYFQCHNPYIDHCGIYAGRGFFVHCSKSRNGVGIDNLGKKPYGGWLVVAKR